MTARGGGINLAAENGLVFLIDTLYNVSGTVWYDVFSSATGSFSASSRTGSYLYLNNQTAYFNSTTSMNPYKSDYTYCFWVKPFQQNAVILDKERHLRLFLTNTNQIQVSIFPTDNFFGLWDIYATGSYLYALNNAGNYNAQFLRYNVSDLKLDFARWEEVLTVGSTAFEKIYVNYPYSLTSYNDQIIIGWLTGVTEITGGDGFIARLPCSRVNVTYGIGDPQTYISSIKGIACDGDFYYFTDEGNNRVQKRSRPSFTYSTHSGTGNGTGVLQYSTPRGIYIDSDYVYVADYGNHRIKKLNKSDLTNVLITGSQGDGTGQFRNPSGLTGDDTYLYVAEYAGHRFTKLLKSDLSYVARTGSSGIPTTADHYMYFPAGISVVGDDLFVASSVNKTIKKFSAADFSYKNVKISGSDNLREPHSWYGVKTCDIGTDKFIHTIDRGREHRKYQPISGNLILTLPIDYDFTGTDSYAMRQSESYFFVASTDAGNKVIKYNSNWTVVTQSGIGTTAGSGIYEWNYPAGICYDDDYIYATDRGNNRIKKLNKSDLTYVTLSGGFSTPYGIEHSSGTLYVVCNGSNRYYIVSASDLSVDGYVTTSSPTYGVAVDENYFYGYDAVGGVAGISKYSKIKPWPRVARYTMIYGDDPNQRNVFYNMSCDNEYIYIANVYSLCVHDKETLAFVNKHSWNEFNFVSKRLAYNPTGSWLNIVLTLGQTSASLYINGEFHVSQSWTGSLDPTKRNDFSSNSPFRFGVYNKAGLYTTESVGMIAGYNRILTPTEIWENYLALKNSRFYK